MPFDWTRFVDLARSLLQQAQTSADAEACLRTVLSRAYFGAYGHARNYARDYLSFLPRAASEDHGRLRAHLKSRRRKGDGDRLHQLRYWRNDADYSDDLSALNLQATAGDAIAYAEAVFASLVPPKATTP